MDIDILDNSICRVKDEPSSPTLILEEFEIDKSLTGSMNSSFPLSSATINVKNEVNSESSLKVEEEFEAWLNSSDFDKELIQREKDFINVFIDGDYSKLGNPLPIEISNQFFKEIQLKSFQVEYLKERLSSHFKLVDLKALPCFKNQLEEINELYHIQIEDIDYKFDWKLQVNSCQSFEKGIPQCSHCVVRQTDACRFKGIRILATDSKTGRVILTCPQWQHYSKYVTSYPFMKAQRKSREKIGKKHKEIKKGLKLYERLNENVPIIECEESQPIEDFQKIFIEIIFNFTT
ncbi:hypothetical protein CONCODRAFT_14687 [Conidiobolus coronatus NRRL 28638]|uniref:Uncharacterized protein n=1 Tax=Conidiobolus coronatus (strain ATCC 28846 / CBS 209.66 / NRRL 28638) TaxID=796925 RepID=A0A137PHW5_CONC2|nr:hypothetical protein CONCODRAFT_14687 [Conidiobolus coronatus NRRL 28638]|eukprot:KXN74521.1 hypothetical protein CONCODRAFT_14687 [Conidiobolus coronatus NRRL 28638]